MLKTKRNKALLSVVIMLAVMLVAFIVLGTLAYYNAQRKAKGSTIFDNGIFLGIIRLLCPEAVETYGEPWQKRGYPTPCH